MLSSREFRYFFFFFVNAETLQLLSTIGLYSCIVAAVNHRNFNSSVITCSLYSTPPGGLKLSYVINYVSCFVSMSDCFLSSLCSQQRCSTKAVSCTSVFISLFFGESDSKFPRLFNTFVVVRKVSTFLSINVCFIHNRGNIKRKVLLVTIIK